MFRRIPHSVLLIGLAALVLLYTVVFFARPGQAADADEAVRVYFADNISPAHRLAIESFNRLHHGRIEVVPVDLPFDKFSTNERKELLTRSLRSKSDKLDVFAVDLIWVPRFARWAEPLNASFPPEDRDVLLSYALESCMVGGDLVAAPMYIDVGLMYYRRDIIRRLPDADEVEKKIQASISWDDLKVLRKRLGYERRPFYFFQAKDYEGLVCNLLELAVGADTGYGKRGEMKVTAKPMEDALTMLTEFVRTGISPRTVTDFDENMSYSAMLDSDAVFVRGWPNFVENFRRFYPDSVKLAALGRAPLPHHRGRPSASVFGGWDLMVSRSSTKKKEAIEFIRFLQSSQAQRLMFEHGGYIPILNSIYQDSTFLRSHAELGFYHDLLRHGFHRPAYVDYTKDSDILSYYAHRAIAGEMPVREALAKADAMIRAKEVLIK